MLVIITKRRFLESVFVLTPFMTCKITAQSHNGASEAHIKSETSVFNCHNCETSISKGKKACDALTWFILQIRHLIAFKKVRFKSSPNLYGSSFCHSKKIQLLNSSHDSHTKKISSHSTWEDFLFTFIFSERIIKSNDENGLFLRVQKKVNRLILYIKRTNSKPTLNIMDWK